MEIFSSFLKNSFRVDLNFTSTIFDSADVSGKSFNQSFAGFNWPLIELLNEHPVQLIFFPLLNNPATKIEKKN